MLENSDAKVVVVEDDEQMEKIRAVRDRLPLLEHVVRMTGSSEDAISLDDLAARGARPRAGRVGGALESRWHPERRLHLHLHLGHHRPAQGLHHQPRQLPGDARHGQRDQRRSRSEDLTYLYLPLAHSFALLIQLGSFDLGATIAYWERDPLKILPNLGRAEADLLPLGAAHLREDLHRRDQRHGEGGRAQEGDLRLVDRGRQEDARGRARRAQAGLPAAQAVRVRRQAGALQDPRPLRRQACGSPSPAPPRSAPRSCASSTPPACSCSRAGA